MNADKLINKLPFIIPPKINLQLESSISLSQQLDILRKWVHFNNQINHKTRLKWHKPILNLAKQNKLLSNEARSLSNITKIYDRLGEFNSSLKAIDRVQEIWLKLSRENNKYNHDLIISYCDKSVTLRLQNKLDLALSTLYEGYEFIRNNVFESKSALIILSDGSLQYLLINLSIISSLKSS